MLSNERICTFCQIGKPATLEYFGPHKECKYGLNPECRICRAARIRKWKHENAASIGARRLILYRERYGERQRELERVRFQTFPLRVQAERLAGGVRERCAKNGWIFPPEFKDKRFFIKWLTIQPNCACCGILFAIGPKPQNHGSKDDKSPSIDRFDVSKPYSLDNVELICWRCNNIKRNYGAGDLRLVADWIESRCNQVGKFAMVAAE